MTTKEKKGREFKKVHNHRAASCAAISVPSFLDWGITGEGAIEEADYIVTRQELLELAAYWAKRRADAAYTAYVVGVSGLGDHLQIDFAGRRLESIRRILGNQVVNERIDVECRHAYVKRCQLEKTSISEEGLAEARKEWTLLLNLDPTGLQAMAQEWERKAAGD